MFQLLQRFDPLMVAAIEHPDINGIPFNEFTNLFSSPKLLLALTAGVLMAFAFQLLFTNLAIAVVATPSAPSDDDDSEDSDGPIGIEAKVGLGLLISISLALFLASFLSVKLSLVASPVLGAIAGVIVWSIFFTLLTWLSSTALGSLLGSVIGTATSGVQSLLGVGSAAVGANIAKNQVVSTAEDITAAVRKELTAGFDPQSLQKTLQGSLDKIQLPKLEFDKLGENFDQLLKGVNFDDIADSDLLQNVNRDQLVKLVSSRTDLSKKDIEKVADQLENSWKKVVSSKGKVDPQALIEQLKAATPEQIKSGELGKQLTDYVKSSATNLIPGGNLTKQAFRLGTSALVGKALQNADLSDIDVEKIGTQLFAAGKNLISETQNGESQSGSDKPQAGSDEGSSEAKSFSVIQADLENYLLFSPVWKLNRETVKQEFRDVLYDAEANPDLLRQELESFDHDYFAEVLGLRENFSSEQVQDLAGYLEDVRADVLNTVQDSENQGKSQNLRSKVEEYLRSTGKEELNPDGIKQDFKTLLDDPQTGAKDLKDRLGQFDRSTLEQLLSQRDDIDAEQVSQVLDQLESTRDQVLSQAKELPKKVQISAQDLRNQVANYLRQTYKEELNPEGIQRDFKTLFEDPQAGADALKERLSQFDRDTLVQLLSVRQDLSEEQVNSTLDQIESVRDSVLEAPQKIADQAKEQYEKTTQSLAEYLRKTNLEELDPDGIQRDLSQLFSDPKAGTASLQSRLSQVDRETLVKLLSQRDDLSEEQVNQAIDKVQSSIRSIVKAPRRLANRVQKKAADFESNLESYLSNTNKEELNPDGIKRDLQQLLQDPQAGLSSLGDRASQFNRETFVALLSQREDISEEEANRIAEQVESSYQSVVDQFKKAQQAVQSTLDQGFDSIRGYLNGLELQELNYDGIKEDFTTLFDDPQMGLEALRGRLSGFDRDTLIGVLSSRDDISQADAERIVGQVESARDSVLNRVEQIQQETQKRIKAVKKQAQKQILDARKAAASAAWWVFGSALFSLAASASGGFLAVGRWFSL